MQPVFNAATCLRILDEVPEFRARLELRKAASVTNVLSNDCITELLRYIPDLRKEYPAEYFARCFAAMDKFRSAYMVNDVLQMSRIIEVCPAARVMILTNTVYLKVFEYEAVMHIMAFIPVYNADGKPQILLMFFSGNELLEYRIEYGDNINYLGGDTFVINSELYVDRVITFRGDVLSKDRRYYGTLVLPCGKQILPGANYVPTDDFGNLYNVDIDMKYILPSYSECEILNCE